MSDSVYPVIAMHEADNVAIVVTTGGLKIGAQVRKQLNVPAVTLVDAVPQGHKVALVDIEAGQPVLRYNVSIGVAKQKSKQAVGYTSVCSTCLRHETLTTCPWQQPKRLRQNR